VPAWVTMRAPEAGGCAYRQGEAGTAGAHNTAGDGPPVTRARQARFCCTEIGQGTIDAFEPSSVRTPLLAGRPDASPSEFVRPPKKIPVVRLRYVHFHLSRYAQPRLSKWYSTRHCKHALMILSNCIVTPISCGVISWFNLALEPRK
jgi:hypothetical protein